MDVLVVVTTAAAPQVLLPLAAAFTRAGTRWGCFVTGNGAAALAEPGVAAALGGSERAVCCKHAWQGHGRAGACPIEAGSQTEHGQMLDQAGRVLSF